MPLVEVNYGSETSDLSSSVTECSTEINTLKMNAESSCMIHELIVKDDYRGTFYNDSCFLQ